MTDDDELGDFNPGTTDDSTDDDMGMSEDDHAERRDEGVTDRDFNTGRQDAISSGVELRGKVKRGTDTRDQDVLVVKARGANAAEAAEDFDAALSNVEERDFAERLRALQPEGDE